MHNNSNLVVPAKKGAEMCEAKKQTELLNAVERYMEASGVCPDSYDNFIACFKDDCAYCGMVRAYLNIKHPDVAALNAKAEE